MVRVRLRIRNEPDRARTLVLEPWTDEFLMAPGAVYELVAEGELSYPLEVQVGAERITVYSFDSAGASVALYGEGGTRLF